VTEQEQRRPDVNDSWLGRDVRLIDPQYGEYPPTAKIIQVLHAWVLVSGSMPDGRARTQFVPRSVFHERYEAVD
jgi:hypothetical protein